MAHSPLESQKTNAPSQLKSNRESGFETSPKSMAPPAFQLQASPVQMKEGDGTETAGPQQVPANGAAGTTAAAADTKTLTLSRGVMQFISEGDFAGADNDCRKPHFPQNIYIFEALTADEKGTDPTKKYEGKRYKTSGTDGRFEESGSGDYKLGAKQDRFATATYTQTLAATQKLGTIGNSGCTISFGVDLGAKYYTSDTEKVKNYFIAGGVSEADSAKLAEAAGLKGIDAASKAATLRAEITLTDEQVIKCLKAAVPDYDIAARGNGTYHPAIEELFMYARYWGMGAFNKLDKPVRDAIAGKTGEAQLAPARDAMKTLSDSDKSWMQPGFEKMYFFLAELADMAAAGYEIKFTDAVLEKADLLKPEEKTFEFVQNVTERENEYGKGKDLEKQITGTAIPTLIKESVGANATAKNNAEDVTAVQQLLYNGDYDVEVNGSCDDKTKAAIKKFAQDEFKKDWDTIDPTGGMLRHLKKFQYKTRTPAATPVAPATTTTTTEGK